MCRGRTAAWRGSRRSRMSRPLRDDLGRRVILPAPIRRGCRRFIARLDDETPFGDAEVPARRIILLLFVEPAPLVERGVVSPLRKVQARASELVAPYQPGVGGPLHRTVVGRVGYREGRLRRDGQKTGDEHYRPRSAFSKRIVLATSPYAPAPAGAGRRRPRRNRPWAARRWDRRSSRETARTAPRRTFRE